MDLLRQWASNMVTLTVSGPALSGEIYVWLMITIRVTEFYWLEQVLYTGITESFKNIRESETH